MNRSTDYSNIFLVIFHNPFVLKSLNQFFYKHQFVNCEKKKSVKIRYYHFSTI